MNGNVPPFLACAEIRRSLQTHPLKQAEVPVEHEISFPLPTRRTGKPAYVVFAAPALRLFGQPMQQAPPDRWWVIDALTGRLDLYAMVTAVPFSESAFEHLTIHPPTNSVKALKTALAKLETELTTLAPVFFTAGEASPEVRASLKQTIQEALSPQLLPQYRAIAPDFWTWLEAEAAD